MFKDTNPWDTKHWRNYSAKREKHAVFGLHIHKQPLATLIWRRKYGKSIIILCSFYIFGRG